MQGFTQTSPMRPSSTHAPSQAEPVTPQADAQYPPGKVAHDRFTPHESGVQRSPRAPGGAATLASGAVMGTTARGGAAEISGALAALGAEQPAAMNKTRPRTVVNNARDPGA